MEIFPPKKIKISDVEGKGRGVIAVEKIKKGEIIEYSPIIYMSKKETDFFDTQSDILKKYQLCQKEHNKDCFMLGYGSLYNHSKNPNAEVDYDTKEEQNFLFFRAIKDIEAGEEIVYDYQFTSGKDEFLVVK